MISWISLTGIAVGTMALVIVLSVYNGIGNLTQSLFNSFDPGLLVQPTKGKTFHTSTIDLDALQHIDGVEAVSQIAEENAWVTYNQSQSIVQLRGVDDHYPAITGIDTMIYDGQYILNSANSDPLSDSTLITHYLIIGGQIYYDLGIRSHSMQPLAVHIPHRGGGIGLSIEEAFNNGYAYPAGNFYIQEDIDSRYILADIDFVRQLMDYTSDECTSLAIAVADNAPRSTQQQVAQLLGPDYTVKNRFEQQPLYYKIFRQERFGIYLILSLIILISTLSLVASLSLLIIDKRRDCSTLRSMGMESAELRRTFFYEGILISAVGVVIGMVVGFVVCFIQQQFGIIKMGSSNFVVAAFPVAIHAIDFGITFLLVMALSTLSVFLTVRRAKL